MKPDTKRHWLRFSLRAMLLGMALMGLLLAWQVNVVRERMTVRRWILLDGGYIGKTPDGASYHTVFEDNTLDPDITVAPWRAWLGDQPTRFVVLPRDADRADCVRTLNAFPEIYYLGIDATHLKDITYTKDNAHLFLPKNLRP